MFFVLIWERHNVMFTNVFFLAGNPKRNLIAFDVRRRQPILNPGEA